MTINTLLNVDEVSLSQEQLSEMIINESRRGAEKYGFKYGVDVQEMESWLISEIYLEIMNNENMQNIKGVRHIIRLRSVDHMRELVRGNKSLSMDGMASKTDDNGIHFGDYGSFHCASDPINELDERSELTSFLDTLSLSERQIVELSSGVTDSLDTYQIDRVKELIDSKAAKEININKEINVWLTTHDISDVLGIHRNTINNTLKRIKEKALDFGLYM